MNTQVYCHMNSDEQARINISEFLVMGKRVAMLQLDMITVFPTDAQLGQMGSAIDAYLGQAKPENVSPPQTEPVTEEMPPLVSVPLAAGGIDDSTPF